MMLEFKINDLISLKLENGKTNIYVNNKLFRKCKAVLFTISGKDVSQFDDIRDINDVIDNYSNLSKEERHKYYDLGITPEVEFWGHCLVGFYGVYKNHL